MVVVSGHSIGIVLAIWSSETRHRRIKFRNFGPSDEGIMGHWDWGV